MVETMNTALLGCQPSGIRKFTALAKAEPGCLFLTIGEPDFSTPDPIKEAAKTALDQNLTHYPPNAGEPYLLERVSQFEREKKYDHPEQLRKERKARIDAAIRHKEKPDRVPILSHAWTWKACDAGYNLEEYFYNYDK